MNGRKIKIDGLEIQLASEFHCQRGGDHRELTDRARVDRERLGGDLEGSAVLCVRCMKAIPLTRGSERSGEKGTTPIMSTRVPVVNG